MDRDHFTYHRQWRIAWLFQMAWRDSRRNRSRLVLFVSSIVLGIAALVAIFSLGDNVRRDIDNQAKTLVGADLVLESNEEAKDQTRAFIDTLADLRSTECTFASMVYFLQSRGTRLVQVRALEGDYPYYGSLETTPGKAGLHFRKERQALVDKTLMLQYNAKVGDSIQVGEVRFAIAGVISKAPGRTGLSTTIAPPVYIPYRYLDQTGLLQKGSRFRYYYYFKYNGQVNVEDRVASMETRIEKAGLDVDTPERRKRNTGRAFEDFADFLTLISFIALLLGCIGVASSIHIYIREKIPSIAVLRCLGATGNQAFLIFLVQILGIGLFGSMLGAVAGTLVQQLLPSVLKDFLPVEITTAISWRSIGKGLLAGLIISLLFGLLPLIRIRKISPLFTLRIAVEPPKMKWDLLQWMIYILILAFVVLFTWQQMHSWSKAIAFTGGILTAFLILVAVAWMLRWMVRRFFPASWPYLWRQAFANLYRPNNQTLILLVTIGLGTAFMGVLYFVHSLLIDRVALSGSGTQPNLILFDIQPAQKEKLADLTTRFNLPLLQQVPIVTMRIEEINGLNATQVKEDSTLKIPRRAFEGELRVTYRDSLTNTEKLTAGKLAPRVNGPGDPIYISVENGYARWLHLEVGDSILFNVQGTLISTIIGSLREVDWRRVQTNFRVIFPPGVLENAPQFHVLVTRVPSNEVSANFQRAVVQQYPNVSIIDLGLILSVLDDVLSKIGFVIRFMAGFSIITGLIVLIASVLISKFQRIQESVLLRTLGAIRKQILTINALEYFFLGALAAATGIILSLGGSWALAKYIFDADFSISWGPVLILFFSIALLTVLIGLANSRSVLNRPPLEILRKEV